MNLRQETAALLSPGRCLPNSSSRASSFPFGREASGVSVLTCLRRPSGRALEKRPPPRLVFLPPSRNRKWVESGKAPEQGLPSLLPGSFHLRRALRGAVSAWIAVISPGAVPHSSDVFQGPGGFLKELFSTPGNCCFFFLFTCWECGRVLLFFF